MKPGRLPFEFEPAPSADNVTSWAGLSLVAEALEAFGVSDSVRKHLKLTRGRREFDDARMVSAFMLLFCAGGDCFDDLRPLVEDQALATLLGHRLPAPETARQWLYGFHEERLIEEARGALVGRQKAYIPEESTALNALNDVVRDLIAEAQRRAPVSTATVDFDATFQPSNKKEAKLHYEGERGFMPMLGTWVEQKLVVFDQFRDGNVGSQTDPLGVVQSGMANLPSGITKRLMRADTALYSPPLFRWLVSEGIEFAVGAQVREGLREVCKAVPPEAWKFHERRPETTLHIAEVNYEPKGWRSTDGKLRYIAIRMTPNQGDMLEPEPAKFLAVVTNRDLDAADVVRWYWAKGGTIEHVHHVLKNELGAGVLPCGRFGSNAAWLRLNVLAFNLLELIKTVGSPELRDARPKKLRLHLFAVPATVVRHAHRLVARIAERFEHLMTLRTSLWLATPLLQAA